MRELRKQPNRYGIEFPNFGHGMLNDPDKMVEYVASLDTYIEAYFENH